MDKKKDNLTSIALGIMFIFFMMLFFVIANRIENLESQLQEMPEWICEDVTLVYNGTDWIEVENPRFDNECVVEWKIEEKCEWRDRE